MLIEKRVCIFQQKRAAVLPRAEKQNQCSFLFIEIPGKIFCCFFFDMKCYINIAVHLWGKSTAFTCTTHLTFAVNTVHILVIFSASFLDCALTMDLSNMPAMKKEQEHETSHNVSNKTAFFSISNLVNGLRQHHKASDEKEGENFCHSYLLFYGIFFLSNGLMHQGGHW